MSSVVFVNTTEVTVEVVSATNVTVDVTYSSTEVEISNLQGPQGPSGVVSVVNPITFDQLTGEIGINATSSDVADYVVQRDANKRFSIGAIDWDRFSTQSSAEARLYWDGNQSLNLGLGGGNVTIALGQEVINYVTNAEATTLNVGEVVYLFGAQGDRPSVKRASNTSDTTSSKTFGIVAEAITAGGAGFVVKQGIVSKVNTAAYAEGDILWLSATPGQFTKVKPVAPNHLVFVGVVLRTNAGNGLVYVSPQNGYELDEIHNVLLTSESDGQYLVYQASNDLWVNKSITATTPVNYAAATGVITIDDASTSAKGAVRLSSSTDSTSEVLAATPKAVKAAYDLAAAAIPLTQKAAANGVATLDASGLVPTNQLPALAITNTFVVASQAAMLALSAETGDVAIRTDVSKSFILTATPASTLANWQELLTPPDAVTSVDGRVGAVTLSDLYAAKTHAATHAAAGSDPVTLSQSQITNLTTDLAAKAPLASPTFTGTVTIPAGSSITGVAYLANANVFTATQTATSFIVTGSTVPTNGIYLPAANTLGFATNGGIRLQINSLGEIGVLSSPTTGRGILLSSLLTGTTSVRGISANPTIQSDVTADAITFRSAPITQATSFTLPTLYHFAADAPSIGAGSAITVQAGFAALSLTGAGTNYGFYGNIASAANRWNFYANGTAANYFAGQTTVGSTSLTLGSGSVAQQFGVVAGAATTVGAVIRGAASQTANLTEWQSSAGAILVRVESSGNIIGSSNTALRMRYITNLNGTVGTYIDNEVVSNTLSIIQRTTTAVGAIVQGAASQSADLVQLQNSSGTVLDAFDNSGNQRSQAQLIQYGAEGSILQNIPTRVHPAETLLKQAVWWIDAAHPTASSQTISNLGWGGSALNVTNGSSTSADSNDAQYLAWDGVNYVYIPDVTDQRLSVPDEAAFDITGDIDIRVRVALDDWTPTVFNRLIGNLQASGTAGYSLDVTNTGLLNLSWGNGTSFLQTTSTVATGITDGTVKWVRATLDVDNGASGNDVKFFLSDDGITWTQLGTTVTTAGVTNIAASSNSMWIGRRVVTNDRPGVGKYFRAQILNGIDGTPVLDVDTSVITSGSTTSFTALTGQTVTVNRATSGRKTVCVTNPLWLFGTDDYMEVNNRWLEHTGTNYLYLPGVNNNWASSPDSAALDITGDLDLRVKVALDDWTPSAAATFLGKWSVSGNFAYLFGITNTGLLNLSWSATGTYSASTDAFSTVATGIADGTIKWIRATLDVDNGASGRDIKFFTSDDGTTWTQLGTTVTQSGTTSIFSGTSELSIGADSFGSVRPARGKFFRAQVLNGIGGTVAFDANFETGITSNLPTTFTESSANAATVTVNYSGTGYRSAGVIASTYVYPGNPNTFKLSTTSLLDFRASDSGTAFVLFRNFGTPSSSSFGLLGNQSSAGGVSGWELRNNGTASSARLDVQSGATAVNTTAQSYTVGSATAFTGIIDRTANTIQTYSGSTAGTTASISSVGSLVGYLNLRLGAWSAGSPTLNFDGEIIASAIWRRALTAAEIATLNNYFQGRVA